MPPSLRRSRDCVNRRNSIGLNVDALSSSTEKSVTASPGRVMACACKSVSFSPLAHLAKRAFDPIAENEGEFEMRMNLIRASAVVGFAMAVSTLAASNASAQSGAMTPVRAGHRLMLAQNACTQQDRNSCGRQRDVCTMVVAATPAEQDRHNQKCEADFNACLVQYGCRY
jgi:hypothetical protein